MLNSLRLSIIIPVLNEQENLSELLPVFDDLRSAGHEVIVVDGGSTDNSKEIALKYADKCLHAPASRARQMNAGAAVASGDILFFMHADSRLEPCYMENIQSCIEQGGSWGHYKIRVDDNSLFLRTVSFFMNLRSRLTAIATGDQGIFVRRDLFEQLGGYAEIPLMEDIELSARLRRISRPVCLSQAIHTSARRWLKNGVLNTIFSMWRFRFMYWLGVPAVKLAKNYYPDLRADKSYAVVIFAKPPVDGKVKTRLAPILDTEERNQLQQQLNERVLELACSTGYQVELWTTDTSHPEIQSLANHYNVEVRKQEGSDLGERMSDAVMKSLRRYSGVAVIGSDCPIMSADYIYSAISKLENDNNDIVLGPAEDGGYVLLAAKRLYKPMFENIDWGTDVVLEKSYESLLKGGIPYSTLDVLWDIDRPDDYRRYQALKASQLAAQEVAANA